jgi:hypothetical protein
MAKVRKILNENANLLGVVLFHLSLLFIQHPPRSFVLLHL